MVRHPDPAPFVGRAAELHALRDAYAAAADGEPAAVLVAGEAGIGKSRLVGALLDDVRPGVALRAQCVDLGELGMAHLALTDLLRGVANHPVAGPVAQDVVARYPVLGDLLAPAGPVQLDEADRFRLFDAGAAVLAAVGHVAGPIVVVVEDIQWIDVSSADFLRFLLARLGDERILFVLTLRVEGLAMRPVARRLAAELVRMPRVRRFDLPPLSEDEVAHLVDGLSAGADASPDPAGAALRGAAGNPFFVEQVVAWTATGLDTPMPRGVTDLLVARLDPLTDDERTVVRAASVHPAGVPDPVLRAVTGLAPPDADRAFRGVVAAGLLVPDLRDYTFAHDLLRVAVRDDLLPGERTRWHAAYGAVLAASPGARPAEVAHHFAAADDLRQAALWSLRAADAALAVHAPDEAWQHLERALEVWPLADDPAASTGTSLAHVTVRAAQAAELAGQPRRADELARRAVALADAEGDRVAGALARVALVQQLLAEDSDDDAAVEAAREAVQQASEVGDRATEALAAVALLRALFLAGRLDEAREHADIARDRVRAAEVASAEIDLLTTLALLDELTGDRERAAADLGTAIRRARDHGALRSEMRAHYALACLHYYGGGDVPATLPVLQAALDRAGETGLLWSSSGVEMRALHAVVLFAAGDLAGSSRAADTPPGTPPDVAAARLAAIGCHAAVARGAEDVGRRFDDLRSSWDIHPYVGFEAGGCEGDHLTWQGEHAAAVTVLLRTQAHLDAHAGEGLYGGLWLSALGLAALADAAVLARQRRDPDAAADAQRQGDVLLDRVERILETGRGRTGDLGPEGRAWALRARAEHARLCGEPAVAQWQDVLDAFGYGQGESGGHAYERARSRWRLADALAAAGDRAAARVQAEAALAAAVRMGAGPLRSAVEATLQRLGAGPATSGVLTAREREVLALVAEGLTNREIGSRIFISEKTVSVHLSNTMAKLNASSRTEAVTVAVRRGLIDVHGG